MPELGGLELMGKIRSRFPEIDFIFITGFPSIDGAVEAAKEGAFYYLAKPFNPDQLRRKVADALSQRQMKAAVQQVAEHDAQATAPVLIGESRRIRMVEAMVYQVAGADCTVLITGESGTGKELVARMVHAFSPRARGPFVAFNCGAMTDTLVTSELFGHEKGAFTGAEVAKPGLIEAAHGGTLFMDEIGDIPHAMQVNLLRVLQEKQLIRVGGRQPIDLDVRVVSATSKNLKALVDGGDMRGDFFFSDQRVQYRTACVARTSRRHPAAGLSHPQPHPLPRRKKSGRRLPQRHGRLEPLCLSGQCARAGKHPRTGRCSVQRTTHYGIGPAARFDHL